MTDQPFDYNEAENEPLINLQTVNKDDALIHAEENLQENPEKIHDNEIVTGISSYEISHQQPSTSTGVQGMVPELHLITLDDSSHDDCNPTRSNTPPAVIIQFRLLMFLLLKFTLFLSAVSREET